MLKKRKQYTNDFKFRVALEACKSQKTLNELATNHGIHPNQISQWNDSLVEEGQPSSVRTKSDKSKRNQENKANFTNKSGDCKWN